MKKEKDYFDKGNNKIFELNKLIKQVINIVF